MIFSETNTEISKALVKAWSAIETPKHNSSVKVKTKNGGEYQFEYTDLTGIFEALKEVYKDNAIMVMQNAYTTDDGMVAVETTFLHESGEWVKSKPLKFPSDRDMQGLGGQITYMKRYSLSAMSGISTEKDDDANYTSGNTATFNQKKASPKQLDFVNKLLKEKESDKWTYEQLHDNLKQKLNTTHNIEEFTSSEASQAIKLLQNKEKQAG